MGTPSTRAGGLARENAGVHEKADVSSTAVVLLLIVIAFLVNFLLSQAGETP